MLPSRDSNSSLPRRLCARAEEHRSTDHLAPLPVRSRGTEVGYTKNYLPALAPAALHIKASGEMGISTIPPPPVRTISYFNATRGDRREVVTTWMFGGLRPFFCSVRFDIRHLFQIKFPSSRYRNYKFPMSRHRNYKFLASRYSNILGRNGAARPYQVTGFLRFKSAVIRCGSKKTRRVQ